MYYIATAPHPLVSIGIITLVIVGTVGLIYALLQGYRWFSTKTSNAKALAFENVTVFNEAQPDLVEVKFHTYCGFLIFVEQEEHHLWATPDDARILLDRLHGFNLKWGLLAYGALVIPLLSAYSRMQQRRFIKKQVARQEV